MLEVQPRTWVENAGRSQGESIVNGIVIAVTGSVVATLWYASIQVETFDFEAHIFPFIILILVGFFLWLLTGQNHFKICAHGLEIRTTVAGVLVRRLNLTKDDIRDTEIIKKQARHTPYYCLLINLKDKRSVCASCGAIGEVCYVAKILEDWREADSE